MVAASFIGACLSALGEDEMSDGLSVFSAAEARSATTTLPMKCEDSAHLFRHAIGLANCAKPTFYRLYDFIRFLPCPAFCRRPLCAWTVASEDPHCKKGPAHRTAPMVQPSIFARRKHW